MKEAPEVQDEHHGRGKPRRDELLLQVWDPKTGAHPG